jgi:hypothetical protein
LFSHCSSPSGLHSSCLLIHSEVGLYPTSLILSWSRLMSIVNISGCVIAFSCVCMLSLCKFYCRFFSQFLFCAVPLLISRLVFDV